MAMIEKVEEHFLGKVAQKAIITRGEEILLARDVNDTTTWEIPGGRLNMHEDPPAGLARELFEELGCDCQIGDIVYIEQFVHQRENQNALLITYEAFLQKPQTEFRLAADELAEVKWVHYSEIHHYHIFDNCLRAIQAFIRLRFIKST